MTRKNPSARTLKVQLNRGGPGGDIQGTVATEVQLLPRQGGLVVLKVQVLDRELEVVRVKAIHGHVVGMRLECGVLGARRVLDAEQTEVEPINAEAVQVAGLLGEGFATVNAVFGIASKGGDVGATNRKAFGSDDRRGQGPSLQGAAKIGLLEADSATEIKELGNRQGGFVGVNTKTLTAAEVNLDGAGGAQRDAPAERLDVVDGATG